MNKGILAFLFLSTVLAGHAAELTPQELQASQQAGMAAAGMGLKEMNPFNPSPSGNTQFSDMTSEVQSSMGLSNLETTGELGGEVSLGYGANYSGTVSCKANRQFVRGGVVVKITNCDDPSNPIVAVCDSVMRAISCSDRFSPEQTISGATTFSGQPLEGSYTVNMSCAENTCDVQLSSTFQQTMGGLEQGKEAEDRFSGDEGHPLVQIGNTLGSDSFELAQEDQTSLSDCFSTQLQALSETGEMPVSCDPGDTRTVNFPVESFNTTCSTEFTTNTCISDFPYQSVTCQPEQTVCEVSGSGEVTTCDDFLAVEPTNISGTVRFELNETNGYYYAQRVHIDFVNDRWKVWHINDEHNWANNGEFDNKNRRVTWTSVNRDALLNICEASDGSEYAIEVAPTGPIANSWSWFNVESNCEQKWEGHYFFDNAKLTVDSTFKLTGPDVAGNGALYDESWQKTCSGNDAGSNGEAPDEDSGCQAGPRVCLDSEPRLINGVTVSPECWHWQEEYTCNGSPVHQTCDVEAMKNDGWEFIDRYDVEYAGGAQEGESQSPSAWKEIWQGSEVCSGPTEFGCSGAISSQEVPSGIVTSTGEEHSVRQETRLCYSEEPPKCFTEEGCSVVERECLEEQDGLCIRQEQTNSCQTETGCLPGMGLEPTVQAAESNFGKVVAATALMEQVEDYGDFDALGNFSVFNGTEQRCKKITGKMQTVMEVNGVALTVISIFFGGWGFVTAASGTTFMGAASKMDCCKDDPSDVELGGSLGFCTQDHVDLAVARLGGRAVKITQQSVKTDNTICVKEGVYTPSEPAKGDYASAKQICRHPSRPWSSLNTQLQFDKYEKWCEFDTLLGRLIQEQGRKQINELASQGVGGSQTDATSFPFFGEGGWTEITETNGNKVAFWQWDEECIGNEDGGAYAAEQQMSGLRCPANTDVYAAVCSQENCEELPSHPAWGFSPTWDVFSLAAETHKLTALNKFTVIEGGCFQDGGCDYAIHAWPAGAGGQLRIPIYMNWPLRHTEEGWNSFGWNHNNVHFRAYNYPLVGGPEPEPKLQICIGPIGGCEEGDWSDVAVSNPINSVNYQVNSSPVTTLMGDCNGTMCDYTAWVEVNLTAMPWYSYSEKEYDPCMIDDPFGGCIDRASTTYDRDYVALCGGFNLDQFMALDIDAMDLSEFTETMSEKAQEEFHLLWQN